VAQIAHAAYLAEGERMREQSVFFLVGSDLADHRDDAAGRGAPAEGS
jgi:hypothetical protein